MLSKMFGQFKTIHFIGIGGIGMSAIAKIVLRMGYKVSGSDLNESELIEELVKMGIIFSKGHKKSNIGDANVIVTSSAISLANPEYLAAKEKKIPIITRGEMLAELMRLKIGIAIAGTHGKTTTTSLVSAILVEAKFNPTAVIGGRWFGINSNAELGKSDYMICEADESDGSFLKLSPVYSIVTNIDLDHMEFYKNEKNLILYFLEYINKIPFFGKSILCFDDERVRSLKSEIKKPYLSYGIEDTHLDVYAKDINYNKKEVNYKIIAFGKDLGVFTLNMYGRHNILNSLAAITLGLELGIEVEIIKSALKKFKGIDRRMSYLGNWKNFKVIDDYGHHPTEIKATLEALRSSYSYVACVFQPHRYTRTLEHYKKFAEVLSMYCDFCFIAEIYPAGEKQIDNVSSKMIAEKMSIENTFCIENKESLKKKIKENLAEKSGILLTIGAGDIYKIGKELVKEG